MPMSEKEVRALKDFWKTEGLSGHLSSALARAGVKTWERLAEAAKGKGLSYTRGVGRTTLAEALEALRKKGLVPSNKVLKLGALALADKLRIAECRLRSIEEFHARIMEQWGLPTDHLYGDPTLEVVEDLLEQLQTYLPWDDDNEHDTWVFTAEDCNKPQAIEGLSGYCPSCGGNPDVDCSCKPGG